MHLTLLQPITSEVPGKGTTQSYEATRTLWRDVVPMAGCQIRFIRGRCSRVSEVVFSEDLDSAVIYFETLNCGPVDLDLVRAAGWEVKKG